MLPSTVLRALRPQALALNPLSSSVRRMCTVRGVAFTHGNIFLNAARSCTPTLGMIPRRWESSSSSAPPPSKPDTGAAKKSEVPVPNYDPDLLVELGIEHLKPERIHEFLQEDGLTLEQLKMAIDAGLHKPPEGDKILDLHGWKQRAETAREGDAWNPEMITDLNPRRRLFPGMTYSPEDLSPNTQVDYSKMREDNKLKGCPLGGRKGPKIDWTNVQLLSRFVSEGGKIIPKRKTNVCSKKQRELARCIRRARQMNLMPYLSKLPQYQRNEAPPIFYKRERGGGQ